MRWVGLLVVLETLLLTERNDGKRVSPCELKQQ